MAGVSSRGRAMWSTPPMVPAPGASPGSAGIVEPVERLAVERGDLPTVLDGQRAQGLLDGPARLGEGAVRVRVVRRPHARVGTQVRDELVGQLLLLEGGDHLVAEELGRR